MIPEHIDPDLLADNAHKIQQEEVTRYFSPEELTDLKNQLADCHIIQKQRADLISDIKDLLKEDLPDPVEQIISLVEETEIEGEFGFKSLKEEIKRISGFIKSKSVTKKEDVFIFFHFDEGKAAVYNINGTLIYTRPLKPDEKQTNLFNIIKNDKDGTNY